MTFVNLPAHLPSKDFMQACWHSLAATVKSFPFFKALSNAFLNSLRVLDPIFAKMGWKAD